MVKPAIRPAQDTTKPSKLSKDTQPGGQTPMLKALLPQKTVTPRSSLFLHSTPPFYACYLLKSIHKPDSKTVYIGSTPSPPRRIRQHNGELAAGAKKTARKRPWVMQMIVYGFPSRLAALQFEWAWQHPHKSRHFLDNNVNIFGARRTFLMGKNVEVVQTMISRYPFTTWPLHVKLFTQAAVQCWDSAMKRAQTVMPPGFTCSIELEGVDGKSGEVGSGRVGPMIADDEEFASVLRVKHTALVASGRTPTCSICDEPLHDYATEPLHSTLCPTTHCTTTSHLTCLSRHFLEQQKDMPGLVPRGGNCKGCGEYTLWGDVVRGCYRRTPSTNDAEQHPDVESDEMFESDEEDGDGELLLKPKGRKSPTVKKKPGPKAGSKRKGKAKAVEAAGSSSGENFDLDDISSCSSDGELPVLTPKRRGRTPRKVAATATTTTTPVLLPINSLVTHTMVSDTRAQLTTPLGHSAPEEFPDSIARTHGGDGHIVYDMTNIPSSSELPSTPPRRKPGRPPRVKALPMLGEHDDIVAASGSEPSSPSTPSRKRGRQPKAIAPSTSDQPSPSKKRSLTVNFAEPEISNISSNSEGVGALQVAPEPQERRPGRPPRKNRGTESSTTNDHHPASPFPTTIHLSEQLINKGTHDFSATGAPSHSRHGRSVHFKPRSPEHQQSHGAPGSLGSPEPVILDQEDYHDSLDHSPGFQEDWGHEDGLEDSGVMHYSPPRTPERADRHMPVTPPSTGGLTNAMAGLSTTTGTPGNTLPSGSHWNKKGIPVIEISD